MRTRMLCWLMTMTITLQMNSMNNRRRRSRRRGIAVLPKGHTTKGPNLPIGAWFLISDSHWSRQIRPFYFLPSVRSTRGRFLLSCEERDLGFCDLGFPKQGIYLSVPSPLLASLRIYRRRKQPFRLRFDILYLECRWENCIVENFYWIEAEDAVKCTWNTGIYFLSDHEYGSVARIIVAFVLAMPGLNSSPVFSLMHFSPTLNKSQTIKFVNYKSEPHLNKDK